MWLSFQNVLFIFLVVAFGFYAGKKNIIPPHMSKHFSALVMLFTFPASLFVSMFEADLSNLINIKYVAVFTLSLMGFYFISFFIYKIFFKKKVNIAAMYALAVGFPNMAFMGIPYLSETLGPNSLVSVAVGNIITSLLMIPISTYYLEKGLVSGNQNEASKASMFKKQLFGLLKKPLIVVPVLGAILAIIHFPVPMVIMKSLKLMGSATSPVALFTLGLMMVQFHFKFSFEASFNIIMKLILQPAIAILLIIIFGLSGLHAQEIIILTAMPTAVVVSMFSENYSAEQDKVVSTIIGSSIVSLITLVLFTSIGSYFV